MARRHTAAVIGSATWNRLVVVPRLPLQDMSSRAALEEFEAVGGTGAGKAANLSRLGIATRLHTVLGDDEPGRQVRRFLDDAGVDVTAWTDEQGTERHLNLLDPEGNRLSIFLHLADPGDQGSAPDLVRFAQGADAVFVNLAEHARPSLALFAEQGVPLWIDVHDWDGEQEFHRDFVDASAYLFLSDVRLPDASERARELSRGRRLVVLTHGSRGATAFLPDGSEIFVPAEPAEVVDANGAGDAFTAGIALGVISGWPWPRTLRAGALVAARAVETRELAHPDLSSRGL